MKAWGPAPCCTFLLTRREELCLCLHPKGDFVPELGEAASLSLQQRAEPAACVPRGQPCRSSTPNLVGCSKHPRTGSLLPASLSSSGTRPAPSIFAPQTPKRNRAGGGSLSGPSSGLGEQGDQQALHAEDAGGGAQAGPGRAGGQEEELPLPAERVQGQLLPQLCRAQGIALVLRGREAAAQEGTSAGSHAAGWQELRPACVVLAGIVRSQGCLALALESLWRKLMGSSTRHALGHLPEECISPWGFCRLLPGCSPETR